MSDDFKIEKGVPIPGSRAKYPFVEMEIGDSFFVEVGEDQRRITSQRISGSSQNYGEKKFSVRTVKGGLRIWRVK